jgi:DNA-binding winged helix-turn-helix (wHTH) protein
LRKGNICEVRPTGGLACDGNGAPNEDTRTNWPIFFGPFSVTKARRLLERDGEPVPVGSRAFDILTHLLEHHGRVVSQRALLAAAWPDTIVGQGCLRLQMAALRKALGNGTDSYNYIINVPGRGYCFTAPISRQDEVEASPLLAGIPIRRPNPLPKPTTLVGRAEAIAEVKHWILKALSVIDQLDRDVLP